MARGTIRNKLRLSLLANQSDAMLPLDFEPEECLSSIEFSAELGTSDQDSSLNDRSNKSLLGQSSGSGGSGREKLAACRRRSRRRSSSRNSSLLSKEFVLREESEKDTPLWESHDFKIQTTLEPPTLSRWESGGSRGGSKKSSSTTVVGDSKFRRMGTQETESSSGEVTNNSSFTGTGGRRARRGSRVSRAERLSRSVNSLDSIPSLVQRQASMKSIRSSFTASSRSSLQEKMEKVMRSWHPKKQDRTPSRIRRQSTTSTAASNKNLEEQTGKRYQ